MVLKCKKCGRRLRSLYYRAPRPERTFSIKGAFCDSCGIFYLMEQSKKQRKEEKGA